MSHHPLRMIRTSALLVTAVAALGAPAAAQITPSSASGQAAPALQTLLWPSWSEQVAAPGLGARTQLTDSASFFRPSHRHCEIASTAGFAAGLVADVLWSNPLSELLDVSPRSLFHDAPALSSLDRVGEAVGQALFCPSPLARGAWPGTGPSPTAATPRR